MQGSGPGTTIFLARHAEVYNPRHIVYGRRRGFDLSPRGEEQAAVLACHFAPLPLAAVYASPLLRARRTAAFVAGSQNLPVRLSPLLLEERRPSTAGWSLEREREFGARLFDPDWMDPRDETMEMMAARLVRFVQRAARRHPGGRVLAISHGWPLSVARLALAGRPLEFEAMRDEEPRHCWFCRVSVQGDAVTSVGGWEAPDRLVTL